MHTGDSDAEGERADREPQAILPRQEDAQAAIGGDDRDRDRQRHEQRVVRQAEAAGEAVHADIVHAGDAGTEQQRRGNQALG